MYDWPEVAPANDRLWKGIRLRLLQAGIPAPQALLRGGDLRALWTAPELLLAQTCGYPFSTTLRGRVCLVGTPSYAIGGAPGHYRSVIVAGAAAAGASLEELAAGTMAFNSADSQSGFRAPLRMLRRQGLPMPEVTLETGTHRASIRAVATGHAAFAAIDAVTWELALRHEPAAGALSVLAETEETWGLPLITAVANAARAAILFDCVGEAIAALDRESREMLLIDGLVATSAASYAPLAADD